MRQSFEVGLVQASNPISNILTGSHLQRDENVTRCSARWSKRHQRSHDGRASDACGSISPGSIKPTVVPIK
jgi:hypothetical protein